MTRYYMDDSIYLKCYFSTGIDPAINFDFVKGLVKNKYTENIKKSTPLSKKIHCISNMNFPVFKRETEIF